MNRAAHIENVFKRGLGMFPNKQFRGGQGGQKEAVCARAPCLRKCTGYIPVPCLRKLSRIRDKPCYPEKMVIPKTSGRWRISNISSCFFRDNFLVTTKEFFIQQILPEQNLLRYRHAHTQESFQDAHVPAIGI